MSEKSIHEKLTLHIVHPNIGKVDNILKKQTKYIFGAKRLIRIK